MMGACTIWAGGQVGQMLDWQDADHKMLCLCCDGELQRAAVCRRMSEVGQLFLMTHQATAHELIGLQHCLWRLTHRHTDRTVACMVSAEDPASSAVLWYLLHCGRCLRTS